MLIAIQLVKEFQHFNQPEIEVSKAVFTIAYLPSYQHECITHLLTPEFLQVLVPQGPPCLLCPLVVQVALFHQGDPEDPTKQWMFE